MSVYRTRFGDFVDDAGLWLYKVAGKCFQWSDATRDHWIGKYVIFPFTERLGDQFETVALAVWLVEDPANEIHAFVQDMLSGWLLSELLTNLITNFASFKDDPVWWVIQRIRSFWPDFYWFAQDPVYMIEFWLGEVWNEVKDAFDDPVAWVYYKIRQIWPDFYWLVQDPAYMVSFWITDRFPFLRDFFDDPLWWFKSKLSDLLDVPMDFFDDPWGWLLYIVVSKLRENHSYYLNWLRTWGESVLRYFYEGVF